MITQEHLKSLFDYCADTGIFRNKKGRRVGHIVPTKTDHLKYYKIHLNVPGFGPKKMSAHRLAWLYVYGKFPDNQIDHIDRNGLNNAISNLRDVTGKENCSNRVIDKSKIYRGGVPPNNKGRRTSKAAMKMRTAIVNGTVKPSHAALLAKYGGSRNTTTRVLSELVSEGVLKQDSKTKRYSYKNINKGVSNG